MAVQIGTRRTARRTLVGASAALLGVLAYAGPAQAAQPSNWSSLNGGIGGANALTTSSLKAATVGSLTTAWSATMSPVTVTDCAGGQSQTYDGDIVAAGNTIVRHQGPVVRAYNAASGAVLWTTDTRKNTTDRASYWRIAVTPDRLYVYQSACVGGAANGLVTQLDSKTGALVNRRSGLAAGNTILGQFGVINGSIGIPGRIIDAATLADRWKVPTADGHSRSLYSASSDIAMYQVGGDVANTIEARRLTDGTLLWSKTGTAELPIAFSSDDSTLFTQNGGLLSALDPATGAQRWHSAKTTFLAATGTDVLASVTDTSNGSNTITRLSITTGARTASLSPVQSAVKVALAGKLMFSIGYTAPGIPVYQSATLTPVATLSPSMRFSQVIPVGTRIAGTTLTSAGLPDNRMVVLAPPA